MPVGVGPEIGLKVLLHRCHGLTRKKQRAKKNTALSDIIYQRKMNSLQVQNSRCQPEISAVN